MRGDVTLVISPRVAYLREGMDDRPPRRTARDALLDAVMPAPGRGLPDPATLDRAAFWSRFATAAPAHVRFAFWLASVLVGGLLSLATEGRTLAALSPGRRERVVRRAARLPLTRDLLDVAKIVACFAYFEDARVDGHFRARP